MNSKISYGIQNKITYGRNWSADEITYRTAHLQRLNPSAVLFLDDDGSALATKQSLPSCAVVGRIYSPDIKEGDFWFKLTPQQCFDRYKNTPQGIIRNISNEPDGYGDLHKLAVWHAEVMDLFGNARIPIVAPNWGEGNPDIDRLADLEPLWQAFDKWHDLHYYGIHEYGSHYGMLYNKGTNHDMYPWRIGRFENFTLPYLQTHNHKIPNVLLTEFGCDSAHDGTSFRGWKTCWNESQYFDEMKATLDKIYHAPHYKGLCIFSWGNTGQPNTESDWITFDTSEAKELHKSLEGLTTTPTPQPPFDYGRMVPSLIEIVNDDVRYINLRQNPSTSSAILSQVRDGDKVEWSANGNATGGYTWHLVYLRTGVNGYMAQTDSYVATPIFTPDPPPQKYTVVIKVKGLTAEQAQEILHNVEVIIE